MGYRRGMKSVTESPGSDSGLEATRTPYVEVTIVSIRHLEWLDIGRIEPFVHLSLGSSSLTSPVLIPDEETEFTFQLDLCNSPLKLKVIDKDTYSKGETLTSIVFPHYELRRLQGEDLWLRIDSDYTEELPPVQAEEVRIEEKDAQRWACLQVRIKLWDEEALSHIKVDFVETSIRSTAQETFTLYHVQVTRADGFRWRVYTRYSRLRTLRSSLQLYYPELQSVPFPDKTYCECLSLLCPTFSRFHFDRIEDRRKRLETFINEALRVSKLDYLPLLQLLKYTKPGNSH